MNREELERLDDQGMAAWDAHDAEAFARLFADDFVLHDWTIPEPIRDKEGVRRYLGTWTTAFPDMRVKQTNRVVGEDAVAGEVEFTGTNTGPMMMAGNEVPPTNKTVMGRGSYIARVRDGKIVEFSSHPDVAGMMMQLGFMPPM
ncbi:MAG TPA: ester cyclase [Actinomycetota bacterium]|nr:ester cyclase [Actinomycetota bacterium]